MIDTQKKQIFMVSPLNIMFSDHKVTKKMRLYALIYKYISEVNIFSHLFCRR